jgi:predicted acyl esterase
LRVSGLAGLGAINQYTIDLHWSHHCFRKGHKVMVQVQSTWFPLIDRNPQKFVPNIFEAKNSDFQLARQRVYGWERGGPGLRGVGLQWWDIHAQLDVDGSARLRAGHREQFRDGAGFDYV